MSAVQDTYRIVEMPQGFSRWPYTVTDGLYRTVDIYRTRCAAEYATRILNAGVASVDPHAIVGCKVVAR